MSHSHTDLSALRAALAHRAADLAVALLGSPNPKIKTKGDLRYGSKGSLSVTITGPKAGVWCDNESSDSGDMFDLIMRARGCKFPDALRYAREFCGVRELSPAAAHHDSAHHHSEPDAAAIKAAAKTKQMVSDIWNDAVDARGTLVETYLASRGLRLPDGVTHDVIRFHPDLYFGGQRVPGMVLLFRDIVTDWPCAIHRTFLTRDGIKIGRKMLGPVANCAIKLSAHEDVSLNLSIGEGIETGIAGMMLGFTPMWALGSAGAIASFAVLPGVKCLTILTDNDKANVITGKTPGQNAARECSQRWTEAGCEVRRIVPNAVGEDIADIVQRQGAGIAPEPAIAPAAPATEATPAQTPKAVLNYQNDPPSLQKLVEDHGGYPNITEEAWHRFDERMIVWKSRIRHGDRYQCSTRVAA
jgi:hypothetical protein